MSEKKGDRKLGRNPFDHKRPSRSKRPEPVVERKAVSAPENPDIPHIFEPMIREAPAESSVRVVFPANSALFFIDLWAGALMEPYFFWTRSVDMVRKSIGQ